MSGLLDELARSMRGISAFHARPRRRTMYAMWNGALAVLLAIGVFVPPAVSSDAASRAQTARSFPKSFSGTFYWHHERVYDGGGETWDKRAKVTFRRTKVYPSGAGYVGSGSVRIQMSGTFRTCTFRVPPTDLSMKGDMSISQARESPTGFEYLIRIGSPLVKQRLEGRCDTPGELPTIQLGHSFSDGFPYRGPNIIGRKEFRDVTSGVYTAESWNLVGDQDENCDELRARVSRTMSLRAERVTLDGSASGPRNCIRAYKWVFEPGDNCRGAALKESTKTGPTPTIVPLCSLMATLTVFGERGKRAQTSARIRVRPRTADFTTPDVKHEEKRVEDPRMNDPPFTHPGEDYGDKNGGIVLGLNVSACREGSRSTPFLCPDVGGTSGLGKRYTLATVRDPGGPFDGFVYVDSAPLTIERIGILNHWFLPGGPPVAPGKPNFYDYNRSKGADVNGFLAAAGAHEGMGVTGRLATGHSGRLQAFVSVPDRDSDPRRVIEPKFGRTRSALRDDIDRELASLSTQLFTATRDPLPEIWSGKLWLYDPELETWVQDDWSIGPSDTH